MVIKVRKAGIAGMSAFFLTVNIKISLRARETIDIFSFVSYAELVFWKPEILSGLQTCNHTFWQFLPKISVQSTGGGNPGKWKVLRL